MRYLNLVLILIALTCTGMAVAGLAQPCAAGEMVALSPPASPGGNRVFEDMRHPLGKPSSLSLDILKPLLPLLGDRFSAMEARLNSINSALGLGRKSFNVGSYITAVQEIRQFNAMNRQIIDMAGLKPFGEPEALLQEASETALVQRNSGSLERLADEWRALGNPAKATELEGRARFFIEQRKEVSGKSPYHVVVYNRTKAMEIFFILNRDPEFRGKSPIRPLSSREYRDNLAWETVTMQAIDRGENYEWGPRSVKVQPGETLYWKLYEE